MSVPCSRYNPKGYAILGRQWAYGGGALLDKENDNESI